MNVFTNLERLSILPFSILSQYSRREQDVLPNQAAFLASSSTDTVQDCSLKELTVIDQIFGPLAYPLMVQILSRCPRIERLEAGMNRSSKTMNEVHATVLRWIAVYKA